MERLAHEELRTLLAAFPGIDDCAVTVRDDGPAGPGVIAYVTPAHADLPAVQSYLRDHLPGPLIPAAIVAVPLIPADGPGRADVSSLPVPELTALSAYRAPDTPRQETICEIFADVLRVPRVGLDDDFFRLGGGSVDAMILAARIAGALSVRLPMAELFDAPTVAELDLLITTAASTERPDPRTKEPWQS
jgi:acyl carrier protein